LARCRKESDELCRGRKVLDIVCGAGRHAPHLHNRKEGFDVLGIDKSPLAIKICRLQGLRKAEVLSITKLSLKNRGRGKKEKDSYSFDTILMLGNNFGLFESFRRARCLLRNFRKMTYGDASIIAQSIDPYKKSHDRAHLRYHKLDRMKGRMPGQTRMRIRYKNYKCRWFDYLFVSNKKWKI
jgi:SAM-dependent methyltransferase